MKILSPRVHGYLDFVVVALFALAPTLFGFSGTPAAACYVLAMVHIAMTMLTNFPMGLAKVIPFTVHGGLEAVVSVALVAMPWVLGFSEISAARNFFIGAGVLIGAVWLTTDYKAVAREERRNEDRIGYGRPSYS